MIRNDEEVVWSVEADQVLGGGLFLDDVGIRNWAQTKPQALTAIDRLEALGIGILGGDVYRKDSDRLVPTYDNWYCDSMPAESATDFAHRSAEVARRYVTNYQGMGVLFSIVPRVREGTS